MNRDILRHAYEEISNGNAQPLLDSLADDVSWTIIGSTALSGTYRGKHEIVEGLIARLRSRLATSVTFTIDHLIAEDDHVVLVGRGAATAVTGRPYNNSYCIVARFEGGEIIELTDYVDTELITRALFGAD